VVYMIVRFSSLNDRLNQKNKKGKRSPFVLIYILNHQVVSNQQLT